MTKWSTGNPPKPARYLVTIRDSFYRGKGTVRQADWVRSFGSNYHWNILPAGDKYDRWEVTAWMKQPDPYKEESQ